jgi:UDP-glucose 4-epimerase
MTRRALVTGGAGFIGSTIADLFAEHGYHVEVIDDLSSGRLENVPEGRTLHRLDIRTPEAAAVVRDGRFDVVVHQAAQIDVRKSVLDPMLDASINVIGTLNLLEAVRLSGRATRFVFASTGGAIYGDFVNPPNREGMPMDPESPYGIAKMSAELYLAAYGRLHKLDTAVLRYSNVYGPRQDPHGEAGVVAIFCNRILAGRPLTVFGDGSQTRDYVYVGDVARANLAIVERELPKPGTLNERAFNVGTGIETSVTELVASLFRGAGRETAVEHAPARPGELQRSCVSIEKIGQTLGWTPAMPLDRGLGETFRWFEARRMAPA